MAVSASPWIRVLIVGDDSAHAAALRRCVEKDPEVSRVAWATTVAQAAALGRRMRPHLVVVDGALRDGRPSWAAMLLDQLLDPARLVYLVRRMTARSVSDATRAGADPILSTGDPVELIGISLDGIVRTRRG